MFETVDSDVHAESRDSQEMALRTADKLLKVLKNFSFTTIFFLSFKIFHLWPFLLQKRIHIYTCIKSLCMLTCGGRGWSAKNTSFFMCSLISLNRVRSDN